MSKILKTLTVIIAATIITTTTTSFQVMADENIALGQAATLDASQGEVVWGEENEYSWDSSDGDKKATVNGVTFKLEDSGKLTVVPTRYIIAAMGNVGFGGNSDVSGDLVLPSKVKIEGKYHEVTKIADKSFYLCTKLKSIVIPDSVRSIGAFTFYLNNSLEKIVLPKNLDELDDMTFSGCYALKDISISSESKKYACEDNILFNKDKTILIRSFNTSVENYNIPDTVESISKYAFSLRENLKTVTIPEGVKEIGECAFSECRGLINLAIPSSVDSIEPNAFEYCTNLLNVTFDENSQLETIPDSAFAFCFNLVNLVLPRDLKKIDSYGFFYCEKLNNICLPNGLKYIGDSAFQSCKTIENIYIPDQVEVIGKRAFAGCANLDTSNIPEGLR